MTQAMKFGNVSVMPGETARGGIPVNPDMFPREREIPLIVVRGAGDGPVLWLNGATHGDEPEGPFSIFRTLEQVDARQLRGTIVAVPVMNVPAFTAGTRGDPLDGFAYDMNRLYPGKPDGYPTERGAWAHWLAMKDCCDLQINIHSGGEHSYLAHMIFASDNPASMELAAAMGSGWPLVFRSGTGGANPSSAIAADGRAGITVELGGNCRTLGADFHGIANDLAEGYLNVLRHYDMIDGEASYEERWHTGYQIPLLAPATGMYVGNPELPFETLVPAGTLIGSIYDLFGDVIATVNAPQDGLIFGMRSRPSVLEGHWCCFFGVVEETVTSLT